MLMSRTPVIWLGGYVDGVQLSRRSLENIFDGRATRSLRPRWRFASIGRWIFEFPPPTLTMPTARDARRMRATWNTAEEICKDAVCVFAAAVRGGSTPS
jgi:hypothetical protein